MERGVAMIKSLSAANQSERDKLTIPRSVQQSIPIKAVYPDGICFRKNPFEMGGKFGRVLFLRKYASFIADDLIADLTGFSRDLILSIDLIHAPTDEAVKEVESIILGVETDITRWQQRQNAKNNFTAEVPRSMEQKRENSREYMDDLTMRDQRMIFSVITIVHTADSLEQLDADTESIIAIGKEHPVSYTHLRAHET